MDPRVRAVLNRMNEHFHRKLSVEQMAETVQLFPSHSCSFVAVVRGYLKKIYPQITRPIFTDLFRAIANLRDLRVQEICGPIAMRAGGALTRHYEIDGIEERACT